MKAATYDRETAVRFVYQYDTNGELEYADFISHFGGEHDRDFCRKLCLGTLKNLAEIDRIIEDYAKNWKVSRMATVDRSLLRVGTFELLGSTTPFKVIINEVVGLARKYGSNDSKAFVNGILHSIAHKVSKKKWDTI